MDSSRAMVDDGALRRGFVSPPPPPPPILTGTTQWALGVAEPAGLFAPGGGCNPLLWRGLLDRVRSLPAMGDTGVRPGTGYPTYAWQDAFVGDPRQMGIVSSGLIPADDPYYYQTLQEVSHGGVHRRQRHPDVAAGEAAAAAAVRLDPEVLVQVVNQVVGGAWPDPAVVWQAALEEVPSKHWQRLLEAGKEACVANTVRAVLGIRGFVFVVMKGEFGHHLFRKLVSGCRNGLLRAVVRAVASQPEELASTARDKDGVKCVRQLLLAVKEWKPMLRVLTTALSLDVAGLMMNPSGLDLIQTCLNRLDAEQTAFIYEGALRNLKKVAKTQHGCLALIQCLDHAAGPTKENLVERIIATSACLSQDPYGNYVVQHIIKLQDEDYTDRLCRELKDYCLQLCTQKHGSHVVEKCIASTGRWHLLEELVLCRKPEQIARDPYGNFVLQRALDILKGYPALYKRLAKALMAHAQSLKSHPSAKHVISKLEKQQPTCMR